MRESGLSDSDELFAQLPPRPDPETGKPFPPPGLSYFGGEDTTNPEQDPYRESRLSHKPQPPPGCGQVLAWHRENRRGKIATLLSGLVIMVVGVAFLSLLGGDGLAMLTAWPVWVVIVVFTVLAASPFSYLTYAAGTDWLLVDITSWGRTKRAWVSLYDLTKIDTSYGGPTFHLWLYNKGGGFSRSFEELQRDRRIWDLVYNGILHSVANGAQISTQAIGTLQLDHTPALRLREARQQNES